MSRIRSIHPGIWTDEDFVTLCPMARLLFIGLWNECDDKGIFEWKPLTIKMRLLPADNVDAGALLDDLAEAGCVQSYTINGKRYGAVRNFAKFQRPKKPNDIHPATAEIREFAGHKSEQGGTCGEEVPNQFPTDGEIAPQMEDEGGRMEEVTPPVVPPRKSKSKRKSDEVSMPADWEPSLGPKTREMVEGWPPGKFDRELRKFRNHAADKGRTSVDWNAALRTWLENADEWMTSNDRKPSDDGQIRNPYARVAARQAAGAGQPSG